VAHITGTKGKSSVAMMIDALLRAHDLGTFRFLSPHVIEVTERLAVNGIDISSDTFVGLVRALRPKIDAVQTSNPKDLPSFFEAMTVMGFLCADQADVDALVMEVGLGGRLDATNVVDPTVAVVTSVALDHTRILGDTIEEIAGEKAGILKPGRPAVTGLPAHHPALEVVAARARELDCPLLAPGAGLELISCVEAVDERGAPVVRFSGVIDGLRCDDISLSAGARHQADNALCAIAATRIVLRDLQRDLDIDRVRHALATLRLPGRCELISGDVPILIDGAHTRESIDDLVRTALRIADGRPIHLLCGLTRDRDPAAVLAPAVELAASVTTTELPTPRSLPASRVLEGLPGARDGAAIPAPDTAFARARERAANDDGIVLVAGSLYLAGQILKRVR